MELRVARASAVVVQRVPPERTEWFLEWQRGVNAAASTFPGYSGTDIYPPHDSSSIEWVIVLHFDTEASFQAWLASPIRAEWLTRLREHIGSFEMKALSGGFGPWFVAQTGAKPPPGWKMVASVVLGLYPTVMLLTVFPGYFTHRLGFAASMLIGNVCTSCLLQWAVMPMLNPLVGPWLRANAPHQRRKSLLGFAVIATVLLLLMFLFRLAKIGEA